MNDVFILKDGDKILKYVIILVLRTFNVYNKIFLPIFYYFLGTCYGSKMEADMRKELFDHLQKMSFSFYDETNTGTLMSRIVSDLFDISELAHHGPEDLFISILKIVGFFYYSF